MPNNVALIALGVFCFLFGVFKVTNIAIQWGDGVMGYSALIAGVICLIVGIMNVAGRKPPS